MKYKFEEHLNDIILWLQNKSLYNADTLSWCLGVAYDRWTQNKELFSTEVES